MEMNRIYYSSIPKPSAVEIRNACKQYSSDIVVLKGLNMTVPQGAIYALLGPSGCGKSTLLNCIVGGCQLDSGSIKLNTNRRSGIGYMPQSLCLFIGLTIYENLIVYGYIFGMSKSEIIARADELLQLLDLPSGKLMVKSLSGGQQRRVSMILTFLHNPEIIILDEPTVGVDINLIQGIWEYLLRLAAEGKTMIITTHYIEETRRAQKVGMMRNGILLAEDNPDILMEIYGCNSMEGVFLLLSEEQDRKDITLNGHREMLTSSPTNIHSIQKPYFKEDDKMLSLKRWKSITYKNFVELSRNYTFLASTILLPLIQMIIYRTAYGSNPKNLHVGVVNEELSFAKCDYHMYNGCFRNTSENFFLSCLYIDIMRNLTYELMEYNNTDEAIHGVKENDVWGAVHFPKNFTNALKNVMESNFNDTPLLTNAMINAWVDLSSLYTGIFVKQDMLNTSLIFLWEAYKKCGENYLKENYPLIGLKFEPPLNIVGDRSTGFMATMVPTMIVMFSFSLAFVSASMEGTAQRIEGAISRLQVAGLSVYEYLYSTLIIQSTLNTMRIIITFIMMYWIFDYTHKGNLITMFIIVFISSLSAMLLGMLNSFSNNTATGAMLVANGINFIVSAGGGLLWPFEGQHPILKNTNWLIPVRYVIPSATAIASKGSSFTDWEVFRGFGIACIWTTIVAAAVVILLKLKPSVLFISQN